MGKPSLLLAFLRKPDSFSCCSGEEWSLFFAEARATGLLPRVASMLAERERQLSLPKRFAAHVRAALVQGEGMVRDAQRELAYLEKALAPVSAPIILLKGGAYVRADLPPAKGRIFSDLDVLVARNMLPEAESALLLGGWAFSDISEYDQRYYREWSHEIPPMTHRGRGTTVDLHHALVMSAGRIDVDSKRMLDSAVPIPGSKTWWRLCDEDLVLHALAHLLLNSEFDRGLRDLGDVDLLVRHFSRDKPDFVAQVMERSRQVGLEKLASLGFVLSKHFYDTPLPTGINEGGGGVVLSLMVHACASRHPDTRPGLQPWADVLLSLRELSLRLPPHLLMRHLLHKAAMAFQPREGEDVN